MDRAGQSRMRQQRVSWLSNAHSTEMQAPQILDQSWRVESHPDLQERILEHLEVTRGAWGRVDAR
jgi:ferritin-like metal-binding protein YciE